MKHHRGIMHGLLYYYQRGHFSNKDETSNITRNNAWFTILLSKKSGFSDYYQRCKMKHHRGIMHGLLYYYQRGQVLVIIIKDEMKHHRGIMHGLLYYYQRGQVLVIIIKDER